MPRQNKIDGHEVIIIASTETFIDNNQLGYLEPTKYVNEDGIDVVRIPYLAILPHFVMKKIRAYEHTMKYLNEFQPDVILFHGTAAYDLLGVADYKMNHPEVKLYVDSHEDFNNSARGVVSKVLLHQMLYKRFMHKALPCIDKVLCVSPESYDFMKDFYDIPSGKLELYPLGGTVFEGDEYSVRRQNKREELQIKENEILLVHSGKMDKAKRTPEILKAFNEVSSSDKLRLVLLGSIPEDMKPEILPLVGQNDKIVFLGWKSTDELHSYLCAADLYLQPGTQSVTMQNAICCGCPVMLYPHKSHEIYLKDNGFFVRTINDIVDVFTKVNNNPEMLDNMRAATYKVAYDLLDYRKLAARLYE